MLSTFASRVAVRGVRWKSSATPSDGLYDVVIAGGGLVGASLASALSSNELARPLTVAIVEDKPPKGPPKSDQPTLRTSTISLKSQKWLESINSWPAAHATSFDEMFVYDQNESITFTARDAGLEALGFVVENDQLRHCVFEQMRSLQKASPPGAVVDEIVGKVDSVDLGSNSDPCSIKLSNGAELKSRLVVGAEGGVSKSRDASGIHFWRHKYNQRAVVANVRLEEPCLTAWQRFLGKNGPLALLPISGGSIFNVVWSTTEIEAKALQAMDEKTFLEELNYAFEDGWNGRKPPKPQEVLGPRASFPLQASHATSYVQSRLALIGDAAHGIHPMAGQGVNLGFYDAEELASILAVGASTGRDIGLDEGLLLKYQGRRMPENLLMTGVLHSLKQIYDWNDDSLSSLRAAGLRVLDSAGPVKKFMINFATRGQFL